MQGAPQAPDIDSTLAVVDTIYVAAGSWHADAAAFASAVAAIASLALVLVAFASMRGQGAQWRARRKSDYYRQIVSEPAITSLLSFRDIASGPVIQAVEAVAEMYGTETAAAVQDHLAGAVNHFVENLQEFRETVLLGVDLWPDRELAARLPEAMERMEDAVAKLLAEELQNAGRTPPHEVIALIDRHLRDFVEELLNADPVFSDKS